MTTNKDLHTAINIALMAHKNQIDKQGKNYILHCLRVMLQFNDIDYQIVAVLHDVIEDTNVTLRQLDRHFKAEIVVAINALTKKEDQSYDDYLVQVCSNPMAKAVKIADVLDNVNRLDQIEDQATKDRLMKKYLKALTVLYA